MGAAVRGMGWLEAKAGAFMEYSAWELVGLEV